MVELKKKVLLHIVDGTSDSIGQDYNTIINEIESYGYGLIDKPRVTVLNKMDEVSEDDINFVLGALRGASGGKPVLSMSGKTGDGTYDVLCELLSQIEAVRAEEPEERKWQP